MSIFGLSAAGVANFRLRVENLSLRLMQRGQAEKAERLLHLLPRFAERDTDIHLPLPAVDGDRDGIAGAVAVHDLRESLLAFDFLAVYGDDEVAADHDGNVSEIGAL